MFDKITHPIRSFPVSCPIAFLNRFLSSIKSPISTISFFGFNRKAAKSLLIVCPTRRYWSVICLTRATSSELRSELEGLILEIHFNFEEFREIQGPSSIKILKIKLMGLINLHAFFLTNSYLTQFLTLCFIKGDSFIFDQFRRNARVPRSVSDNLTAGWNYNSIEEYITLFVNWIIFLSRFFKITSRNSNFLGRISGLDM